MRNQWLAFDKGAKKYVRKVRQWRRRDGSRAAACSHVLPLLLQESAIVDVVGDQLRRIRASGAASVDPDTLKELRKRQLVDVR